MKIELELEIDGVRDVARAAGLAVVAIALCKELLKSPAERTWHGDVAGVVPYDFRPPTLERLRDSYWNPEDPSLFTPMAFGVGWAVNFPALAANLGKLAQDLLAGARSWNEARR